MNHAAYMLVKIKYAFKNILNNYETPFSLTSSPKGNLSLLNNLFC